MLEMETETEERNMKVKAKKNISEKLYPLGSTNVSRAEVNWNYQNIKAQ